MVALSVVLAASSATVFSVGSIVSTGILLLGVLALAVAYYRASYAKATIATLKDSNAALTERVEILEDQAERCNKELDRVTAENTNLKSYVAGTEAIALLRQTIENQHHELMQRLDEARQHPRRPQQS